MPCPAGRSACARAASPGFCVPCINLRSHEPESGIKFSPIAPQFHAPSSWFPVPSAQFLAVPVSRYVILSEAWVPEFPESFPAPKSMAPNSTGLSFKYAMPRSERQCPVSGFPKKVVLGWGWGLGLGASVAEEKSKGWRTLELARPRCREGPPLRLPLGTTKGGPSAPLSGKTAQDF